MAVDRKFFEALKHWLNSPLPTIIADWPEFILPHAPPDDAADGNGVVPRTREDAERWLQGLPWMQQTIGELVGLEVFVAEMNGRVDIERAPEAIPGAGPVFAALRDAVLGFEPWEKPFRLAEKLLATVVPHEAWFVVERMFSVAVEPRLPNIADWAGWWRRVRCRLAFHAALEAAIEPPTPSIIAALESENSFVRRAALGTLARIADPTAIEPLTRFLMSADANESRTAATAFARLAGRAPLPVAEIVDCYFTTADEQTRWAADQAIEKLGGAAVRPLLRHLDADEWTERRRAAELLGGLGMAARAAVPGLRKRLRFEKSKHVRTAIESAIGQIEAAIAAADAAIDAELEAETDAE